MSRGLIVRIMTPLSGHVAQYIPSTKCRLNAIAGSRSSPTRPLSPWKALGIVRANMEAQSCYKPKLEYKVNKNLGKLHDHFNQWAIASTISWKLDILTWVFTFRFKWTCTIWCYIFLVIVFYHVIITLNCISIALSWSWIQEVPID